MSNKLTLNELDNYIYNNYRTDTLKDIYNTLFHPISDLKKKLTTKTDIVFFIAKTLFEEKSCKKFINSLDGVFKELIYDVVWNRFIDVNEWEKFHNASIIIENEDRWYYEENIDTKYHFFSISRNYDYNSFRKYTYYFRLPFHIRNLIKKHIEPKPEDFYLKSVTNREKTTFSYSNNDFILKELKSYFTYIENNDNFHKDEFLYLTKYSKSFIKGIKDKLQVREFFDEKGYESIRTEITYRFIKSVFSTVKYNQSNMLESLKFVFDTTIKSKLVYLPQNILLGLNGISSFKNTNSLQIEFFNDFTSAISNMKINEWYSANSFTNFILYSDAGLMYISPQEIDRKFYFSYEYLDKNNKLEKGKKYIDNIAIYTEIIIKKTLKGLIFLFASFGIFDIEYNSTEEQIKSKEPKFISPFDEIKYLKLTPLGSYLLGFSKSYIPQKIESNIKINLSENELTIHVEGKDIDKLMILNLMAEKITESLYKVSYSSFLKNCDSIGDITNKIDIFKEEISSDYPKIWDDFFNELIYNYLPISRNSELVVFDILNGNNKKLVELFLKDEVLKTMLLKVEGQKIAIKKVDFNKFKLRLESFGFLLPKFVLSIE